LALDHSVKVIANDRHGAGGNSRVSGEKLPWRPNNRRRKTAMRVCRSNQVSLSCDDTCRFTNSR
jgi:hypothetical protein